MSSALAKWLVAIYPVGEVMFFRSFSSLVVCAVFILPVTGLSVFATKRPRDAHRARPVAVDLADLHCHRIQPDAARRRHRHQFLGAAVGRAAVDHLAQGTRRAGALDRAADRLSAAC